MKVNIYVYGEIFDLSEQLKFITMEVMEKINFRFTNFHFASSSGGRQLQLKFGGRP
jgi:hypothetical protein